ncbi:MAG TPA: hypothetical protein VH682_16305 [Gemmataceae bacterium]|jgi:hypothetical protein
MMELLIRPGGVVRCIYGEAIDLHVLGVPHITRASLVEPEEQGRWWSDLSPVHGPRLGPFRLRTQTLDAEQQWLSRYWLTMSAANVRP